MNSNCRYQAAEDVLAVADLYDPREQWASFLLNAIKAQELFKREVNYIVKGGEIVIVDEFTGRTMPGRRRAPPPKNRIFRVIFRVTTPKNMYEIISVFVFEEN